MGDNVASKRQIESRDLGKLVGPAEQGIKKGKRGKKKGVSEKKK